MGGSYKLLLIYWTAFVDLICIEWNWGKMFLEEKFSEEFLLASFLKLKAMYCQFRLS